MYLKSLSFQGVRNLIPTKIELGEGLNIFHGLNGAGKSSVVEALGLITTGRSFRTHKLDLVTQDSQDEFVLSAKYDNQKVVGLYHSNKSKSNKIKIDGEFVQSLASLVAIYPTQILSPESYHLIDSGPSERRKFVDWILFHVEHSFTETWKNYSKALAQRNALLRSKRGRAELAEFEGWDSQLIELTHKLTQQRTVLLATLKENLVECCQQLSLTFLEEIGLEFYPGFSGNYADRLAESFRSDLERGFTQYGPHKADIRIKIGKHLARDVLSRGQKKVLVNALFLSQIDILKQNADRDSLFIIDDISSELDSENQSVLLGQLLTKKNTQIVVTSLQLDALNSLKKGYNRTQMFHVEHGMIHELPAIDSQE